MIRATECDTEQLVDIFTRAFIDDPAWGWAFPDPAERERQHRTLWSLEVHSALPYGWAWMSEDGGAATLWNLPGCPELTPEDKARFEQLIDELPAAHAADVRTLLASFYASHPHREPHCHLSLLATHPSGARS